MNKKKIKMKMKIIKIKKDIEEKNINNINEIKSI